MKKLVNRQIDAIIRYKQEEIEKATLENDGRMISCFNVALKKIELQAFTELKELKAEKRKNSKNII